MNRRRGGYSDAMRRLIALITLGVVCACGSQTAGTAQKPGQTPRPVTLTSGGAVRYNEPLALPPASAPGGMFDVALHDAAASVRVPVPVWDPRLSQACADLASVVPEEGAIAYSAVEFALQSNGIIEPSPHLLVVWGDLRHPAAAVQSLQPSLAGILARGVTRFGFGAMKRNADGEGAIVIAFLKSHLRTGPIPRAVPAGASFQLDLVLDSGYQAPIVDIFSQAGDVVEIALRDGGPGTFSATVECDDVVGKLQVGITANGGEGTTTLANFPVWCGAQPPSSLALEERRVYDVPSDPGDAERRLFELINRDRQVAGRSPLQWDEAVASIARAHSQEMRRTHLVSEVLTTTGSVTDHLKSIRNHVRVNAAVAKAYGVAETHRGLFDLPTTRRTFMSDAATHIGIGIVYGELVNGLREMFVAGVVTTPDPP